jgi:alkanesulfonate monooxygenase SsuD/methylene tetrahydromethanopterin reductase-like flavin-dependent oxidoreductase (luciferase family)
MTRARDGADRLRQGLFPGDQGIQEPPPAASELTGPVAADGHYGRFGQHVLESPCRAIDWTADGQAGATILDFGMFFELQLPRPWVEGNELELVHQALEWAELGEAAGIGYAWAQEHHFLEEYSHSSAPEVFLSAVSQRTKRMRYNHPARVAERIAMLDLVSNGRAEWGTGESSSRLELDGFGVSYIEKRAMWAEATREAAKMLVATPYPGYRGKHFSMPARNVVPKPVQQPHPPMWVACTTRDTVKLAARLGLGALTFAFMDASEAAFWVDEYYRTFKEGCTPIGRTVNPNIAMLSGVMVNEDGDLARARGLEGQQFFKWALSWYFRFGTHTPGRTNLWDEFRKAPPEPMAGVGGIGSPEDVRAHFRALEAAGVDQVILLQQAGGYRHDDICASLELLGRSVIPEFADRRDERRERKRAELEPFINAAMARVEPIAEAAPDPVEAYPVLWARQGYDPATMGTRRTLDAGPVWRAHMGGGGR